MDDDDWESSDEEIVSNVKTPPALPPPPPSNRRPTGSSPTFASIETSNDESHVPSLAAKSNASTPSQASSQKMSQAITSVSLESSNASANGSGAVLSEQRIKTIFDELSSNYLFIVNEERKKQDGQQMTQIQTILKDWTENITMKTKALVEESLTAATSQSDTDNINSALADAQARRSKILEDIKEAHNLQLQILKAEIAEERRDAAQAQIVFEQTLRTKYDNLVVALQEKIKTEQEARMQRALEDLERSARLESERAKQSMELQQAAEVALSTKFKSIVGDLRKSWEDEELQRAKFLEERLRGHYSAVLEHMEAQLHMALQLQDDADKRWMEDVQERNRQQIESMKAFEEKCTRLYDTRLKDYVNQSEDMINQYETQLLQVGNTLAMERYQFESRQRRLRLACSKWKVDYQKHLHEKYRELLDVMERRYGSEIETLLQQISNIRKNAANLNQDARDLEQDMFHENTTGSATSKLNLNGMPVRKTSHIRSELESTWTDLNTPPQDRIDMLASLLDDAEVTPELLAKFNDIMAKLSTRVPIVKAISRKQFLEYKIKLANRAGEGSKGNNGPVPQVSPELITELNELQTYINEQIGQYEATYNESFHRVEANDVSGVLRPEGSGKMIPPSPMSGFPTSGFSPTKTAGTSMSGSAAATARAGNKPIGSTIHRKMGSPDPKK